MADPSPPARPELGSRYWSLWWSEAVSSLGDGLALVGLPILALSFTRSPLAISGLMAAQRLPWLVCSLPLGALADRSDRRRLTVTIEMARMAILVAFAATLALGGGGLVLLYLVAFALGGLETGFFAATSAVVPDVVCEPELARANGHLYAVRTAGEEFAGPALGGLLIALAVGLPFILDGVSFAVSGCLLLLVFPRRPRRTRSARGAPAGSAIRTTLANDIREGIRFLFGHRLLRLLVVVISAFAFCQAMVMGVLVRYGLVNLHLTKPGYGLFLAVGAAGSVLAGTLAGRAQARLGIAVLLIASGLAAGVAYVLMGIRPWLPLAAAALLVECLAVGWGNVASLTLRQRIIPPDLLGRVSNAFRMLMYGAIPVGALVGGAIGSAVSLPASFEAAGVVQLGVVVLSARRLSAYVRDELADVQLPDDLIVLADAAPAPAAAPTAAGRSSVRTS